MKAGAVHVQQINRKWPLAEFVMQRHSTIRLLLAGCPRRSGQVVRHLLFRPSHSAFDPGLSLLLFFLLS